MAIKYNLDRAVAWFGFHRHWYFWNYVKPHGYEGIAAVPPNDQTFYYILLLTSLPFLFFGIILTLRRLRSAEMPLALSLLFFLPVINLLFFVVLCLLPAKQAQPSQSERSGLLAWLPVSPVSSALASMVIVGLAGMGLACFATQALRNYGWGLFVALPFAMGMVSVLIYAGSEKRTFRGSMSVAVLPILFCGLCLFVAAAEGIICLVMAAPMGIVLALLGGMVGYAIVGNRRRAKQPGGDAAGACRRASHHGHGKAG